MVIIMKINSIPPKEMYYQYVHVKDKIPAQTQTNTGTDKVELTSDARTFSATLKAAKDSLETRSPTEQKRIDAVKQQIQNNTYSVSGYMVAEKILGR